MSKKPLRSGRFFDNDFSNQRDGYATSENTLVEKSYFKKYKLAPLGFEPRSMPFILDKESKGHYASPLHSAKQSLLHGAVNLATAGPIVSY